MRKYPSIGGRLSFQRNRNLLVRIKNGLGCLSPTDDYQKIHCLYDFRTPNNINGLSSEDNSTWAATNEGIYQFDGSNLIMHLTQKNGLPSSLIMDCMKDKENNYWAATDRGLVLFNDTINKTFFHALDSSSFVNHITIDSTGTVWCLLGEGHICKIKGDETSEVKIGPQSLINSLKGFFGYTFVMSDHLKRIWIVSNDELMHVDYNGNIQEHYPLHPWLSSIYEDKQGNFWIATHTIQVLHQNKMYSVSIKDDLAQEISPASMVIDKHGTMWLAEIGEKINLGTVEWGVDKVTIHITRTFSNKDGLVDMRYAKLAYDSVNDEIWAGSFWNGISRLRLRNDRLETLHFNYENGFSGERLMTIFFDKKGGLFCRLSVGLYHFTRNGDNNYSFDKYTIADGLAANEIHSLYRDKNDNFWVGTHEGITFFHPNPRISHLPPPKVFVERVTVNGEQKREDSAIQLISLDASENAVSFEFYATSYRNNNRLLYSYSLEN